MSHSEEFVSVKEEPKEEQQLPHQEFEFASVKEEPKEKQHLPHQKFEFVSVVEETEEEQHLPHEDSEFGSVKEETDERQQLPLRMKLYDNYKEVDVSKTAIEKSLNSSIKDETKQDESGGQHELESIVDRTFTLLTCRSVRIGNYRVVPKYEVLISSVGMQIPVTSVTDVLKAVTVNIRRTGIRKVLINYRRGLPVIFFYTNHTTAMHVRQTLGMESCCGFYFDPDSQDETQRLITFLPERITEENNVALKTTFGNIMSELSDKAANELLVRASPKLNLKQHPSGVSPVAKRKRQAR